MVIKSCFLLTLLFFIPKVFKDTIPISQVIISGISIGDSKEILETKLGKPDSIVRNIDNVIGLNEQYYYYHNNLFLIKNTKIKGFEINNNFLKLECNNIRIGDNISKYKKIFPEAYSNRYILPNENSKIYIRVFFSFKNKKLFEGVYLIFENNKLIKIKSWEDI